MKERIKELLAEAGLTKAELARKIGITDQHINNFIVRSSVPKKYIKQIEDILNTNVLYLETGKGSKYKFDNNVTPSSVKNETFGLVPLFNWNLKCFDRNYNNNKDSTMIECHTKHGANTFALKINGASMTAEEGAVYTFPENYIIIVDPDQSDDKTSDIFVIAKQKGENNLTFRQLKYDGTAPYLNPLNNSYPKIFNDFEVVGKVISVISPDLP
jgi:SOS-response transcriptional repressor LexA